MEHRGWGVQTKTVGDTVTIFPSSRKHGELQKPACACGGRRKSLERRRGRRQLVELRQLRKTNGTGAKGGQLWGGGFEEPAAPRQAVLTGRQGPLSLLGCSPDLCPRGRGSFQFALCWIICFADASFLVTLEMKTVEGDFGRV